MFVRMPLVAILTTNVVKMIQNTQVPTGLQGNRVIGAAFFANLGFEETGCGRANKDRGKAMPKKKSQRIARITLRVAPVLHSELAFIADVLGLDINGLIRLMIAHRIDHYRLEAMLLQEQSAENQNLLLHWRERHPGRPIREFWDDYWRSKLDRKRMEALELAARFLFEGPVGQVEKPN